jgi:hypothetical protein
LNRGRRLFSQSYQAAGPEHCIGGQPPIGVLFRERPAAEHLARQSM